MNIFDLYPLTTGGIDTLPTPEVPYYVLAKDGLFLHRRTQIGTVLVKQPAVPKNINLTETGFKEGIFSWTGPKIPGRIISQATSFFRRVYDTHKTEAEVLITMHNDTGAFRLFVPYQRTSGAGVKSIYEPTHIDRNYTVVGTLHSHCHFTAFHSGTDSADASDMDGIHFTIGMLQNNPPQIVAMAVMNKKEFHYKNPGDIAELVFDGDEAPLWWDQYVFPTTTATEKPKNLRTITQEQWNAFRGLTPVSHVQTTHVYTPNVNPNSSKWLPRATPSPTQPYGSYRRWGGSEDSLFTDWESEDTSYLALLMTGGSRVTNDSAKFNKRHKNKIVQIDRTIIQKKLDDAIDLAIEGGTIQSEDWASMDDGSMDDPAWWRNLFLDKIDALCNALDEIDVDITYSAKERV